MCRLSPQRFVSKDTGLTRRANSKPPLPSPHQSTHYARHGICPDEPLQQNVYDADARTIAFKGYQIHELAHFCITGILLSKHFYDHDAEKYRSVLSPGDFAIGWGPMSNPSVLKNFSYFQKNRFFYFACYNRFANEAERLGTDFHTTNIHLIPTTNTLSNALSAVNLKDIVTLKGSLVEVFYNRQRVWKSSMANNVTGDGACKVLLLKEIEWKTNTNLTKDIPLPAEPKSERIEEQSLSKTMGR